MPELALVAAGFHNAPGPNRNRLSLMQLRHDLVECYAVRPASNGHEFLLLRRAPGRYLPGIWHTVAGQIEPGETAVAAALRELGEETALEPRELYCLDRIGSFFVPSQDTLWHAIIFCALVSAEAAVRLNPEHDAFRWVSRASAAGEFLWPSSRDAILQIGLEILDGSPAKRYMQVPLH